MELFLAIAVDQDGDAQFEVALSRAEIEDAAKAMAETCYETPRQYIVVANPVFLSVDRLLP